MPIHRSTRPITPQEHARYTAPVTEQVLASDALLSTLGRGAGFLLCAGIGVSCLLSLDTFSDATKFFLAVLASILTLIGVFLALPLPAIWIAAATGKRRTIHRRRLPRDAALETWQISARSVYWTTTNDGESLSWVIETNEGELIHISGNDDDFGAHAAWLPGEITVSLLKNSEQLSLSNSGPLVPYVELSAESDAALYEPSIRDHALLVDPGLTALKARLKADATRHAEKHGPHPPAP